MVVVGTPQLKVMGKEKTTQPRFSTHSNSFGNSSDTSSASTLILRTLLIFLLTPYHTRPPLLLIICLYLLRVRQHVQVGAADSSQSG